MLTLKFYRIIKNTSLLEAALYSRTHISKQIKQVTLSSYPAWPADLNQNHISPRKQQNFSENKASIHRNFYPIKNRSWGFKTETLSKESEKEFLVRVKNNPDEFGGPFEPDVLDEGDLQEEKHFTEQVEPHRRLRTKQYADQIKACIRQRKIKEAIDILEIKMLQEDKVKPEAYIYNLLLGACGRVGYTKKAFMLYNNMKKRGLNATGGTYTALFNACANSPWPTTDGLSRAKHLYEIMIEKGVEPNDTNYNAMIKAFGRCGDLPMAFTLVDKMSENLKIKDDTINFLLQACISDPDVGFRHSLLVWRKVVEKKIRPSVYTFNLLLRSVRDCGLGDLETTQDIIGKLVGQEHNLKALAESSEVLQLDAGKEIEENENLLENKSNLPETSTVMNPMDKMDQRPNLLAPRPHLGNILSLSEVKKSEDRLLLLGGCKGFLETMASYKCTPDIKTFTQLLDSIPSTSAAEKQVIVEMKKYNVKPDIDFYNMLIKKKSLRFDYSGAKEVLKSMKQMKFRPNLVTYGVLALGCTTKEQAIELVNEMKSASYSLNAAILGAMLRQACVQETYDYIFEIMELCLREQVPVSKRFLEHLDFFKKKHKTRQEEKKLTKKQVVLFGIFKARYKTWLTEVQIDESEDAHPWQQYRQNYPEDKSVSYQQKDTARFKPRHTSLFRVKTSKKYRNKN